MDAYAWNKIVGGINLVARSLLSFVIDYSVL